ncbi:mitochondrial acetyl-CoA acetyltransferase [Andalucia godoyi]|uniref:acetyl-CoA C-acetyltransferase n=1 Tax=Andalucia godoyi TaxID=505711 RepID=A0A8K0AIG1_ANDGO|nr:mitochondrial acetyl-CoA acetyltransferase [Andalucia godoyi]|eukprot:ANDGO_03599.mRNA.1 mitochondrial acetyl-CoA acetyltransferase
MLRASRRLFSTFADTDVVICSIARTPIGSFNGSLSSFSAPQLGAMAIRTAVERAGISKSDVQEVIMGNVVSAGSGQAPSRQATLFAELPNSVISTDINKVCASGMKAIMVAAMTIQTGHSRCIVAGGMESMSNIPYYLPKARNGLRYGHGEVLDGILRDGLLDAYQGVAMGFFADATARKYGITREDQDAFAVESYKRATEAAKNGNLKNEIFGVSVAGKKGDAVIVSEDEEVKNVKYDRIPTLKPAFEKNGTVTAANSSKINDGAAALVLMSGEKARSGGYKPLARIVTFADAAHEPEWFTTTPELVITKLLNKKGMKPKDVDFFEINEAFAVVSLTNNKLLGLDPARVNVFGGAVAMGHPIGCSGARIVGTVTNVLHQKNGQFGVAAICNGGGGGSAILVERL